MRIKEAFGLDVRFRAFLIAIPLILTGSFLVASGWGLSLLYGIIGVAGLFVFLRHPEFPMSVLFPLFWLFWSYYFPVLGGRLERAIGLLAIAGVMLVLWRNRQRLLPLPSLVTIGLILLFGAYLVSSVINQISNPIENLISLVARLLLLYLAYFLLRTPQILRFASFFLIVTGFLGASIILFWNINWGLGFFRTYQGYGLAKDSLDPFWFSLLLGGNSLTFPAVLLIGLVPNLKYRYQRVCVMLGSLFLFAMAFVSQFRREILVSVLFVLIYFLVTNFGGLRKVAIWALLGFAGFYFFVLSPSEIFQARLGDLGRISAGTDPRLISFYGGLQAFMQSPFFGSGPASYVASVSLQIRPGFTDTYYYAYNTFLYFAVEAGLFGLLGLLLIIFGVFRSVHTRSVTVGTPQGWIITSAPGLLIVLLVSFMFGNYYEMSLPWYLMGMILAAANLPEINPATEPARDKSNVWHLRYNAPKKFN